MKKHPRVYIVAGSNGCGKTTFALEYLPTYAGKVDFINADLIAKGLSPLDADKLAFKASRIFLGRINEVANSGVDFAFETTLSGVSYARILKNIKNQGYHITLFYLWIPNHKLAIARIKGRVLEGGHHVPEAIVKRRFNKTLKNLFNIYMPLLNHLIIFDNSSQKPRAIFEKSELTNQTFDEKLYDKILHAVKKREK